MGHGLIAQQPPGVVDEKSCRVEHHQHLGDQRLYQRLAYFARDGRRNLRFPRIQFPLELAQHVNPPSQPQFSPRRLRRLCSRHRSLDVAFARTIEFAQNFTRRRIHRHKLPRRDL